MGAAKSIDAEQRCYDAFVAAMGDAQRLTGARLLREDGVTHEDLIAGLASAHIHGVACSVAAVALTTGRPAEWIAGTMIKALRERIDEIVLEGVPV